MAEIWKHQVRVTLEPDVAEKARTDPEDRALEPLVGILAKHKAALKCQYDAFADYVAAAEEHGEDKYPLYRWTKATIEDPAKQAKYIKSFTVYAEGQEVYSAQIADALQADLEPLVGGPLVSGLSRHDTNPANNPQPPKRFRPQSA